MQLNMDQCLGLRDLVIAVGVAGVRAVLVGPDQLVKIQLGEGLKNHVIIGQHAMRFAYPSIKLGLGQWNQFHVLGFTDQLASWIDIGDGSHQCPRALKDVFNVVFDLLDFVFISSEFKINHERKSLDVTNAF